MSIAFHLRSSAFLCGQFVFLATLAQAEPHQIRQGLFCLNHAHQDGCLALLGKNNQPLYLLVASQGPQENEHLLNFLNGLLAKGPSPVFEGRKPGHYPWFAVLVLPAAKAQTQAEQEEMEARCRFTMAKVKEQFLEQQQQN